MVTTHGHETVAFGVILTCLTILIAVCLCGVPFCVEIYVIQTLLSYCVDWLKMSGAMPPLFQCAFMAWTWTTLCLLSFFF